jgi:hypothetical protein
MHAVIGAIIVANSCVVSRADIVTAMTTQLTGCHHMPTRAVAPTATLARGRTRDIWYRRSEVADG